MALFGTPPAAAASSTTGDTKNDIDLTAASTSRPQDSISDLMFSPGTDYLAVASWDKNVYIYNTQSGKLQYQFACEGHVLCVAWSSDGKRVVAGDTSNALTLVNFETVQVAEGVLTHPTVQQFPKKHTAAIKCVRWVMIGGQEYVASGSWDKMIMYWDASSGNVMSQVQCMERVYTMDVKNSILVVGTAERHIHMINLAKPNEIAKNITSPLKWQTRVVSCFADASGFAVGSIEGRCAIQYAEDKDQSLNFSFKCHRVPDPTSRDTSKVYSVNAISFHPIHGTFSTAGSDGTFHFWDKDAKHRLKGYPAVGGSITATGFSRDGNMFAYAISYDWSKGYAGNKPDLPTQVKIHQIIGDECKPRPGSKKR
ncbi:putative nuclear pore complex protein [Pleomassaria siparia CBS 279.74]|uniref:Putative nuclear pore complex protein n=1 Tax=Pleomassaria siparia CBS 279.74 TaxID=1314801 RepID=A0A6G1JX58_9PLEO|nr:putative nuclear pore complex protein [Pleomassaria siparia CBS 279.74]